MIKSRILVFSLILNFVFLGAMFLGRRTVIHTSPAYAVALQACKADLNGDGLVDLSDYSLLVSNFLKHCGTPTPAASATPNTSATPAPSISPKPSCAPRPACLDGRPPCKIQSLLPFCPTPTLKPKEITCPKPPACPTGQKVVINKTLIATDCPSYSCVPLSP